MAVKDVIEDKFDFRFVIRKGGYCYKRKITINFCVFFNLPRNINYGYMTVVRLISHMPKS